MALSYVQYPGNGSTKAFDVTFGYLSRSHVFVFVNDELVAFSWTSPSRIELEAAPAEGVTITIRRLTDRVNRVTSFTDGQTLLAGDLNAGDLQNFYIAQEMLDQVTDGILMGTIVVSNPGEGYITEQWIQDQLQASIAGSEALTQVNNAITAEAATRASAIAAEASARATAVAAEASARVDALLDEAAARTAAVSAEASARAAAVAAEVSARTAALATEAADRAAAIAVVQASADDIAADLAAEVAARTSAVAAVQAQVTTLSADLSAEVTARLADVASAESYALGLVNDLIADLGAGLGTGDLEAAIIAETSARTAGDTALASSLDALVTQVNTLDSDTTALVAAEANARSTADSALSTRVGVLETTIDTPTTGLSARVASVETATTNLQTNKAEASAVSTLTTKVNNAPVGSNGMMDPTFRYPSTYWALQNGTDVSLRAVTYETRTSGMRVAKLTGNFNGSVGGSNDYVRLRSLAANGIKVRPGERVGVRVLAGGSNLANIRIFLRWRTAADATVGTAVITDFPSFGTGAGEKATFTDLVTFGTAPTGAEVACLEVQFDGAAAGTITGYFAEPVIAIVAADQAAPPYFSAPQEAALPRLVTAEGNITTLQTSVSDLAAGKAEATSVTVLTSRVSAAEADIDALETGKASNAALTTVSADLLALQGTVADLDAEKAEAVALTALEAEVAGARGGTANLNARIAAEETARASADSAASTRLNTLEASVNTPTTGLLAKVATLETTTADLSTGKASASSVSDLTARVTTAEGRITTEESVRASADAVAAGRLSALETSVDTAGTGLKARMTSAEGTIVDLNANKASASSVSALQAEVTTARGGSANLNARITAEETARASADSAASTRLNALESTVNTPTSGLSALVASLQTTTADLSANKASASSVSTLQSEVTNARGGSANLKARLDTEESTRAAADSAASSRISVLESAVTTPTTGLSAKVAALETTTADLTTNKAEATQVNTIQTELTNARNGAANLKARIDAEESARVSADSAASSRLNALESSVNTAGTGLLAKVASHDTTLADLSANKASASSVTSLTSRVTTAEGNISSLQAADTTLSGRVTTAEGNITTLQTTTSNLSTGKADASTVTALQTKANNLQAAGAQDFTRTFELDGLYWTGSETGSPGSMSDIASTGFATTTDFGRVRRTTGFSMTCPKGVIPAIPNSVWEIEVAARVVTNSTVTGGTKETYAVNSWRTLDGSYAGVGYVSASAPAGAQATRTTFRVVDGVQVFKARYTVPASPTFAFIRPRFYNGFDAGGNGNAVVDTLYCNIRNVSAEVAIEGNITTLQTTTSNLATNKADASVVTAINSRVTTAEGEIDTLQSDASALTGRVTTAEAAIISEASTRAAADSAATSRLNALESTVNTAGTGLSAKVTSLETTVADHTANKASASSVTTLTSRVTTAEGNIASLQAADTTLGGRVTTAEGNITSLQTTTSNLATGKADATALTALSSRVAGNSSTGLMRNPRFAEALASGAPPGWAEWASGSGTAVARWNDSNGYAFRLVGAAGQLAGRQQTSPSNSVRAGGRYRVVSETVLVSGTYDGAGFYIDWLNEAGTSVGAATRALSSVADAGGVTSSTQAGARSWDFELLAPAGATKVNVVFMSHWTGHTGSTAVANSIDWSLVDVLPTTARLATAEGNITTLQTTTSNLSTGKADASTVTALSSRVAGISSAGLLRNSRLVEALVGSVPPGWISWTNGTGTITPRWNDANANAFRLAGAANTNAGCQQNSAANSVRAGAKYRVVAEAVLVTGTYDGAGVYIDWKNASLVSVGTPTTIGFANTADAQGVTSNSQAGPRTWDIEVTAPAGAARANVYFMSHWSSLSGGTGVANSIDWHLVDLVPTTSRLATAESNITTLQTTTADLSANKASASSVTTLTSRVTTAEGEIDTLQSDASALTGRVTTAEANIVSEASTRAAADSAAASRLNALESTVNTPTTGLSAKITAHDATLADLSANKASASSVTALAATVGDNTADITSLMTAMSTESSSEARLLLKVNTVTNVATIEAVAIEGNGTWNGSAIKLDATLIQLLAKSIQFGDNTVFEDTYNSFYTTASGKRNRWGGPFPASGELMEWFGPDTVPLNSETLSNGYWAKGTDGDLYQNGAVANNGNPLTCSFSPAGVDETRMGTTLNINRTVTATAGGGTGPYTYAWAVKSMFERGEEPFPSLSGTTTASVTMTRSGIPPGTDYIGALSCTVTDTGTGTSKQFVWSFSYRDFA